MHNEKSFGGLVVKIADIKGISTPEEFLSRVGLGAKEVYFQQAIIRGISARNIPCERLFVFTPEESFEYEVSDGRILSLPSKIGEFSGKGTLDEAVKQIKNVDATTAQYQKLGVLYFDDNSKQRVEQLLLGIHVDSKGQNVGTIRNGYEDLHCNTGGYVKLFSYLRVPLLNSTISPTI